MAQGMKDIKRRMRSIGSTMKITKAMHLVSSAKLRKAKESVEKSRPYYETIGNSVKRILSSTTGLKHPFLENREIKKTAYIIVTADRGLAGGYNSNILRAAEHEIDKENSVIIVMGSKGKDYFTKRGYNIIESYIGMTEEPEFIHARNAGNIAIDLYRKREVDEVKLIYTKFISVMSQEPIVDKLLPADIDTDNVQEEKSLTQIQYEPSPEDVIDYLIPKYIQSTVYGGLVESAASQQGARMTAMESATDNAEEMIDELGLKYNRARQAAITQEISEIVGGAEALK